MTDRIDRFILNTTDGIRIISKPEPQPDTVIPSPQGDK